MALLSVRDLRVEFATSGGVVTAVDGASFEVGAGETVALLGESGSGKSVTAQAVMGIVPKPAGRVCGGSITYDDRDLLAPGVAKGLRGREIAMVFQDPLSSLNPVFRVGAQIGEMFRRHRGASRREARAAALDLMKRVGIPAASKRLDDYPHQFSGGMRQRVMIAMALALSPRLLIADEPTTALDVTVQAQIMDLLARLQAEEGMSLVLITHDLGVVAGVADRVILMYAGRVVETGPLREVYEHSGHPYTSGLMASIPELEGPRERLVPIQGSPPDLLALPSGCSFRPRCRYADEQCAEVEPVLRQLPDRPSTHQAACHHPEGVLTDVH
ncbi:peptide/nickel transport system ATP-binding protein/oligopeptide transport system ATP-binding protein [Kribbella pratensis]|jgi:peptide/nickel transport system ATP-binding protein/oligopeptide transport system ATP-binding protein|uniref:Peptide/nickel transport system ATP-binding protein/oligopeptide transport system ATP-binding protein n=1 Tax=Kribbella pratensis TaxID=2512112 RepID=A0ABY2FQT0_9ACTN|nr:ABC transporter ATP-binding protein [Kribbella pratensis]TDW95246.1 peptide/nickel transport system ATP-binding protein/oligopeptide transport system ATP-binding protein [Kribbella pratensis]